MQRRQYNATRTNQPSRSVFHTYLSQYFNQIIGNSICRVRKLHALHTSGYISPSRCLLSTNSSSFDSVLSSALGLRLRLHEKPSLAQTR